MILAEKIMSLRKRSGWSQEELAEQLDVSRQSVSKWESGTSIPDIEKIIKMSELFSVSTDYLLKDSDDDSDTMVDTAPAAKEDEPETKGKVISMELATEYMDLIKGVSKKMALAVVGCILSPVLLILLTEIAEVENSCISENTASAIGLTALFLLVAASVMTFITVGMKLSKYEYLEKEPITLKYGVEAVVNRKKEAFAQTFGLSIATGVIFCILSVVPVVISGAMNASEMVTTICVCVLFVMVSAGVFLFVSNGMIHSSYAKLLQEEDFTPEAKANNKKYGVIYGAYWCLVTAGYLARNFLTNDWGRTWIIWPIAGILFVVFKSIVEAIGNRNK